MTDVHLRSRFIIPSTLAVVALVLAWRARADPRWHRWLDYDRDAVAAGQAWRLVTGHAMHLTTGHALLDVVALLLVAWIFGAALGPRRQVAATIAGIVCIDASLWLLHPEVDRYVGLSGVLHAWFVVGALAWLLEPEARSPRVVERRSWGGVLLLAVVVKLALEDRRHAFWLDPGGYDVVTAAHRAGALAGLLCGVACVLLSRGARARAAGRASRHPRPAG